MVPEHNQRTRPLLGGIVVLNPHPSLNVPGTLGVVGTTDGADRWILSCYHVLGRFGGQVFGDGEPIYQPGPDLAATSENLVAVARPRMSDRFADFAAAEVVVQVTTTAGVLGIGAVHMPSPGFNAQPGQVVLKSGRTTGVTEGVILANDGYRIRIASPSQRPPGYLFCDEGDSGALVVLAETKEAVALLRAQGEDAEGRRIGYAVPISPLLDRFGLRLIS